MSANENTFDLVAVTRCSKCRYYDPEKLVCKIHFGADGEPLDMLHSGFCSDGKV